MPTLKLLSSGYWHVRWSANRWIQWPKWGVPTLADGFGWISKADVRLAERIVEHADTKED